MKIIVKEDLVSCEVALRLHDKGIHIVSDHTIIHERGSHTLEYFKPTQSQVKNIPVVANVPNGGVALIAASANTVTLGSNTNGATCYTAVTIGGGDEFNGSNR